MKINETIRAWWPLITRYSNPFSIVLSGVVAMVCAGLLMLVVLILLRRFVLVKRSNILLRILSIAYFVALPVLAGIFGFKWGLIRGLRNDLASHVAAYLGPADAAFRQKMRRIAPFAATAHLTASDAIDLTTDLLWKAYHEELLSRARQKGAIGYIAATLMRISDGRILATAVNAELKDVVKSKTGIDQAATAEVLNTQWKVLLDEGLFTKIATLEIEVMGNKMMKGVCIVFALILLLPVVEISVSWHFARLAMPPPA